MNDQSTVKKSNSGRRLVILLSVFVIGAGGIFGLKQYLKSQVPKGNDEIAKTKFADSEEDPAEKVSGLAILSDIFSGDKESKEVIELKEKSAKEAVFTYDAIMKMSAEDLEKNIIDVTARLQKKRNDLPPSLGGTTAGGSPGQTNDEADGEASKNTVAFLALPLEVMKQVVKSNK